MKGGPQKSLGRLVVLLVCVAVLVCSYTFHPWKVKVARPFHTSRNTNPATKRHVLEELIPEQNQCENLNNWPVSRRHPCFVEGHSPHCRQPWPLWWRFPRNAGQRRTSWSAGDLDWGQCLVRATLRSQYVSSSVTMGTAFTLQLPPLPPNPPQPPGSAHTATPRSVVIVDI